MDDLAMCPFCGQPPTVSAEGDGWSVCCDRESHVASMYGVEREDAIRAWNRDFGRRLPRAPRRCRECEFHTDGGWGRCWSPHPVFRLMGFDFWDRSGNALACRRFIPRAEES